MPLDAAGLSLDPLTKLSITPIPEDFVTQYKSEYEDRFFREHPLHVRANTRWMTICWSSAKHAPTSELFTIHNCSTDNRYEPRSLTAWLAAPTTGLGNSTDTSGTPEEIIDLAERVHREVPNAAFELDYFEKDPILNVVYEFDGNKHKACLGIWDNGKVIAIAHHS